MPAKKRSTKPAKTSDAQPEAVEPEPAAAVAAPEPADARLVPTHEQIAARAGWLFLQGSTDATANWLRAEREMERVVNRAYALFLEGSADGYANWMRALGELE